MFNKGEIMSEKKSVRDIVVENILQAVEQEGKLPWQMPYVMYNSFNWATKHVYRGINRLLLPHGEYLTMKQLIDYNENKGTNYRVERGMPWRMVVFAKDTVYNISLEEANEMGLTEGSTVMDGYGNLYHWEPGQTPVKNSHILRYSKVIERRFCVNPDTNKPLPSRIDTGEVTLVNEDPDKVVKVYLEREKGLSVDFVNGAIPSWSPHTDTLTMNKLMNSEGEYWSTFFHEIAHSTSHPTRLNRSLGTGKEGYAKEECVAEITAALLCAECGVVGEDELLEKGTLPTKVEGVFNNSQAYVKTWANRIENWGGEFVSLVSQADKAFYYILGQSNEYTKNGDQR